MLRRGRFNPRTREGCDLRTLEYQGFRGMRFNPRTREGCDRRPGELFLSIDSFNPRTREGCDSKG